MKHFKQMETVEKQHFGSRLLLHLIEEDNYHKDYEVFLKCTSEVILM